MPTICSRVCLPWEGVVCCHGYFSGVWIGARLLDMCLHDARGGRSAGERLLSNAAGSMYRADVVVREGIAKRIPTYLLCCIHLPIKQHIVYRIHACMYISSSIYPFHVVMMVTQLT